MLTITYDECHIEAPYAILNVWYKNIGIHFQVIIDRNKLFEYTLLYHLEVAYNKFLKFSMAIANNIYKQFHDKLFFNSQKGRYYEPGNTNWRGRLSTVDFLIKVASFVKKVNNLNIKRSWSKLVGTRRSTVPSFPLQ
jgi:hypothetical protein